MTVRVVSAMAAGWPAVDAVMQSDATSRHCSCQFHVLTNAEQRETTRESRREMLETDVTTLDPPRGLVAFDGDEPIGWCAVEPRVRLRHVLASRLVVTSSPFEPDDPGVWAISCILVPPKRRGAGVGGELLAAAVAHAKAGGATAIEGYPFDAATRGGRVPSGFSTGTLEMFRREGFEPVAALPSGRTLVHLRLT
jgi:GNAT superfamily N-acetyltransferase